MKIPFLSSQKKPEYRRLILDIEDSVIKYGIEVNYARASHITHCGTEEIKKDWEHELGAFLSSFQQIHISPSRAVVSLPSSVSKARIFKQRVLRGRGSHVITAVEAEKIASNVIQIAGKKIAFQVARETGIPPVEWMFLRLAIIGMFFDGYEAGELSGNNVEDMEFTVLGILCLRSAFASLENLCKVANITVERVVHGVEAVDAFGQNGVYVNMGETGAHLLLVQEGSLRDMVQVDGLEITRQIEQVMLAWQQSSSIFAYGRGMSEFKRISLFPEDILAMFPSEMIQQTQYTPLAFLCYESA